MKMNYVGCGKKAQYKIQQMAFMILAVVFFFILVGLFFLGWQYKNIKSNAEQLQKEEAISSLRVIADMPELNCNSGRSFCIDEDKLNALINSSYNSYNDFWPVESIKVYRIYPKFEKEIKCPGLNCNYFAVYDSKKANKEYAAYVSICKKIKQQGFVYEKCEIGKLLAGVKDAQ